MMLTHSQLVKCLRLTAAGWLRDKATEFKHKNVDFTWVLLHFYKVVRPSWKRNRDALISWILMVHHETARTCHPSVAVFFQLANNMNCEASSAVTNATASVALSGSCCTKSTARMVPFQTTQNHTQHVTDFPCRVQVNLFIPWKCSKCGFKKRLDWNGVPSELNAFHRNLLTTQVALQVELDFAHNVVKRPPKKYSEVPKAGDAHLISFPPNCYVKRLCSLMLHMFDTCLTLGGSDATLTLRSSK